MKTFTSKMRQNCARRLLIFGLLAGLFFSGGEGIQLFPFPVSERGNSEIKVSDSDENSKSYAFSVFSSRSAAQLKAKFQKNSNQYLSGESFAFAGFEPGAKFCRQRLKNLSKGELPRFSPVAGSKSKRAPPAAV